MFSYILTYFNRSTRVISTETATQENIQQTAQENIQQTAQETSNQTTKFEKPHSYKNTASTEAR